MRKFIVLMVLVLNLFSVYADSGSDPALLDLQWQQYVESESAKAFGVSFPEGMFFHWTAFESSNPFTVGPTYVDGNPIEYFSDHPSEPVYFPASDGQVLKGLFFPVENAKGTVIVLHGRGSNLYWAVDKINFLMDNGYQVFAYNARFWNYHKNPKEYVGKINADVMDVSRAIDYVKSRLGVNHNKIALYGFSYGAYKVMLAGAGDSDVRLVISDGGQAYPLDDRDLWFSIKGDMDALLIQRFGENRTSLDDTYVMKLLGNYTRPLLILHGVNDSYVSAYNPDLMYREAVGPKELHYFSNSGHCDAVYGPDKELYIETVVNFLDAYLY